jgi:hypothetical protein
MLSSIESPFVVEGARNVFLETIKRESMICLKGLLIWDPMINLG